jgi:hypothetical protein
MSARVTYRYACARCEREVLLEITALAQRQYVHVVASDCVGVIASQVLGWTIRGRPVHPSLPVNTFNYEVHPAQNSWYSLSPPGTSRFGGPTAKPPVTRTARATRPVRVVRAV